MFACVCCHSDSTEPNAAIARDARMGKLWQVDGRCSADAVPKHHISTQRAVLCVMHFSSHVVDGICAAGPDPVPKPPHVLWRVRWHGHHSVPWRTIAHWNHALWCTFRSLLSYAPSSVMEIKLLFQHISCAYSMIVMHTAFLTQTYDHSKGKISI